MKNTITIDTPKETPGIARLLYLAALLWLGYLLLFLVIDRLFVRNPPVPWYYATNALCALLVLGLAWWKQAQAWLGRAFLPIFIGLMSAVPILANHLLIPHLTPGPGLGPDSGLGGGPGPGQFPPGPTTSAEGMAL